MGDDMAETVVRKVRAAVRAKARESGLKVCFRIAAEGGLFSPVDNGAAFQISRVGVVRGVARLWSSVMLVFKCMW